MSQTIFLVRHTQVAVDKGICYGQKDVELASTYPLERQKIQTKLANTVFTHAYTSPLKRCKFLGTYLHPEIIVDSRLAEMNFGLWEGRPWDEIYALETGKAWFANYLNKKCPGGEAYTDLFSRVASFAKSIANLDGNILVVTHAGVVRAMLELLCGVSRSSIFTLAVPYGQIISITGKTMYFYE